MRLFTAPKKDRGSMWNTGNSILFYILMRDSSSLSFNQKSLIERIGFAPWRVTAVLVIRLTLKQSLEAGLIHVCRSADDPGQAEVEGAEGVSTSAF